MLFFSTLHTTLHYSFLVVLSCFLIILSSPVYILCTFPALYRLHCDIIVSVLNFSSTLPCHNHSLFVLVLCSSVPACMIILSAFFYKYLSSSVCMYLSSLCLYHDLVVCKCSHCFCLYVLPLYLYYDLLLVCKCSHCFCVCSSFCFYRDLFIYKYPRSSRMYLSFPVFVYIIICVSL